jgi:hypothetical protein
MAEKNTYRMAYNVELISMMDALAREMEVTQRRWDSQCRPLNYPAIAG